MAQLIIDDQILYNEWYHKGVPFSSEVGLKHGAQLSPVRKTLGELAPKMMCSGTFSSSAFVWGPKTAQCTALPFNHCFYQSAESLKPLWISALVTFAVCRPLRGSTATNVQSVAALPSERRWWRCCCHEGVQTLRPTLLFPGFRHFVP